MLTLSRAVVAGLGALALAGSAPAQQPGIRTVPRARTGPIVVTPPQLNPTVLQATTLTPTAVYPGLYSSAWGYNPWLGPYQSSFYSPPSVVQQNPGRYIRLPDGTSYNPWTGSTYNPYSNTFYGSSGTFYANPWSGTYTNPVTGASYNPLSGTMT